MAMREIVEPEELENLIADRSANRAADAILAKYIVTPRSALDGAAEASEHPNADAGRVGLRMASMMGRSPPPPSDDVRSALADELREAATPFAKLGGGQNPRDASAGLYYAAYYDLPEDTVIYENSGAFITVGDVRNLRRALRSAPVPVSATIPDFDTAALALGFQRMVGGKWMHPNQHHFTKCYKSAEEIFDWNFGKHWLSAPAVGVTREAIQEACDLLAERKYGNPARSPSHNARLLLESLLRSPVPDATVSEPGNDIDPAEIWEDYCAEVPEGRRSPQGALAFGVDAVLSSSPPHVGREALECWSIIEQLRAPECAEVCLFCDNPDVGAGANNALEVCDFWTDWKHVRFEGDTILEALRAALKASKDKHR